MDIRRADGGDVAGIVAMSSRLFAEDGGTRDPYMKVGWPESEGEEYFGRVVGDEEALCLVAGFRERIVGYLVGRVDYGDSLRRVVVAELESMYVMKNERSRGVGTALVGEFFRWGEERGAELASVTAYAANGDAIRFYGKHGFVSRSITLERGMV